MDQKWTMQLSFYPLPPFVVSFLLCPPSCWISFSKINTYKRSDSKIKAPEFEREGSSHSKSRKVSESLSLSRKSTFTVYRNSYATHKSFGNRNIQSHTGKLFQVNTKRILLRFIARPIHSQLSALTESQKWCYA